MSTLMRSGEPRLDPANPQQYLVRSANFQGSEASKESFEKSISALPEHKESYLRYRRSELESLKHEIDENITTKLPEDFAAFKKQNCSVMEGLLKEKNASKEKRDKLLEEDQERRIDIARGLFATYEQAKKDLFTGNQNLDKDIQHAMQEYYKVEEANEIILFKAEQEELRFRAQAEIPLETGGSLEHQEHVIERAIHSLGYAPWVSNPRVWTVLKWCGTVILGLYLGVSFFLSWFNADIPAYVYQLGNPSLIFSLALGGAIAWFLSFWIGLLGARCQHNHIMASTAEGAHALQSWRRFYLAAWGSGSLIALIILLDAALGYAGLVSHQAQKTLLDCQQYALLSCASTGGALKTVSNIAISFLPSIVALGFYFFFGASQSAPAALRASALRKLQHNEAYMNPFVF